MLLNNRLVQPPSILKDKREAKILRYQQKLNHQTSIHGGSIGCSVSKASIGSSGSANIGSGIVNSAQKRLNSK